MSAGCVAARVESDAEPEVSEHTYHVGYHVSCSVSDECRIQYIDGAGQLTARDIVGEWDTDFGADPGGRLWIRAGAGGCPPRSVRVEIHLDDTKVAEDIARAPAGQRCEWILAETEFRVP